MVNTVFKRQVISTKRTKKSMTIPDQSMSIQEIVKRFVRGIPVDVVQRKGVYIDQSDHDLERMSRMDFGEKAALADEMRGQADSILNQLKADERTQKEKKAKAVKDAKEARAAKAGIGMLDNTMPVDTKLTTK